MSRTCIAFRRRISYRSIRILSVIVILGCVGSCASLSRKSEQSLSKTVHDTGWMGSDTFRVRVRLTYSGTAQKSEQRKRELRKTAVRTARMKILYYFLQNQRNRRDHELSEEILREDLKGILERGKIVSESYSDHNRKVDMIFAVSAPRLKYKMLFTGY